MAIGEKLERLLKLRSRNVNDLSAATNISPSTLYSIIRRNNMKVDLSILQSIADELCVTLDYFAERSQDYQSKDEYELLQNYRGLNELGKSKVNEQIEDLLSIEKYTCVPPKNTEGSN